MKKRTIGNILKRKRTDNSVTLEEIAFETKMKGELLESIEMDDFSVFSSHVHAKGFIKNFAKYLQLDPDPLIALYRREIENIGMTRVVKKEVEEPEVKKKSLNWQLQRIVTGKQLLGLLVILILVLSVAGVYQLGSLAFNPPYLEVTAPFEISAPYQGRLESNEQIITIKGKTESGTEVKVNDVPVKLAPDYTFESSRLPVTDEGSTFVITGTNRLGKKSEIKIEVSKAEINIEEMNAFVVIKNGPTNLTVKTDKAIQYQGNAIVGDSLNVKAKKTLEIESSIPANVSLFINDVEYSLTKSIEVFENSGQEIIRR